VAVSPEIGRDALLAFYDFPAEHWKHLRTTNPIREHLRDRAPPHHPREGLLLQRDRARHGVRLVEAAERSWRRLDGHTLLPKLILGVKFADGSRLRFGKQSLYCGGIDGSG